MNRVFIDSSVLIAASISPTGNARALLLRGMRDAAAYELTSSELVLEETARNLARKAPGALPYFDVVRAMLEMHSYRPPESLIQRCARTIHVKDAAVVAAAVAAQAAWLASYDRRHLLALRPEIESEFGVVIATPDEILTTIAEP